MDMILFMRRCKVIVLLTKGCISEFTGGTWNLSISSIILAPRSSDTIDLRGLRWYRNWKNAFNQSDISGVISLCWQLSNGYAGQGWLNVNALLFIVHPYSANSRLLLRDWSLLQPVYRTGALYQPIIYNSYRTKTNHNTAACICQNMGG